MGKSIAQKIIEEHLLSGEMKAGAEIGLRIDQTLTQDATGTMAYLEFESMGLQRVRTERSVAYIDHNTLQSGFENADDHRFIQSAAKKYGIWFSRPGNGICHQVHLERFGVPGKTLIGSDSHTPTGGGLGMLAFGAGGMDVAVAMGGGAYYITMPRLLKVELSGRLQPFVTAKDVALEILRLLSVKGGVGYIIEWGGEGVRTLSVPERATIANMGAELGATTSIFPSDEVTRQFLAAQGREGDFRPLESDPDAVYDKVIKIDLGALEPLIALPHSPDRVVTVRSVEGKRVDQVCIGSCTNSSLADLLKAAAILRGHKVAEGVSASVSPGSRQVLLELTRSGALADILGAGVRLLECACGPCIGMGFAPGSGGVSLRTFNRNFEGRSGTADAGVYLCSPETAAVSAIHGTISDPRTFGRPIQVVLSGKFAVDDSELIPPAPEEEAAALETVKGPNIHPFPVGEAVPAKMNLKVSLKTGDNITTDHIMPAGAKILPYRSNIPYMSGFCFSAVDPGFPARAKEYGRSVIVGGSNYGQGSSREHAALVPLYLGVRAVIAKSFARIHAANLINAGIIPFEFENPEDYECISLSDELSFPDLSGLGKERVRAVDTATGKEFFLRCVLTGRSREILRAGGLLNYTKEAQR